MLKYVQQNVNFTKKVHTALALQTWTLLYQWETLFQSIVHQGKSTLHIIHITQQWPTEVQQTTTEQQANPYENKGSISKSPR